MLQINYITRRSHLAIILLANMSTMSAEVNPEHQITLVTTTLSVPLQTVLPETQIKQ